MKSQDQSLVRLLHKKTTGLTQGDIKNSLKRTDLRVGFPVMTGINREGTSPPKNEKRAITSGASKRKTPTAIPVTVTHLIEAGLIQPPLELEVTYKKNHLTATIQRDGTVRFHEKTYTSLSVAGGMARNSINGPPRDGRPYYQTNGWTFWRYRDQETGTSKEIDSLRRLYLERSH